MIGGSRLDKKIIKSVSWWCHLFSVPALTCVTRCVYVTCFVLQINFVDAVFEEDVQSGGEKPLVLIYGPYLADNVVPI